MNTLELPAGRITRYKCNAFDTLMENAALDYRVECSPRECCEALRTHYYTQTATHR